MKSINDILKEGVLKGASDLHLTIGMPVTIRRDGKLEPLDHAKMSHIMLKSLIQQMINSSQYQTLQEEKQLDFSYQVEGLGQFRVNAYHQRNNLALAIRVIPTTIPNFKDLSLPPILEQFAGRPKGLVLITGPTGSGKSTTLAAMIQHLNHSTFQHIITLEDPIEFNHPNLKCMINQREIGSDAKDFKAALKVALRQDPDVIMIGELRDAETIQIALTAAETGHLVLATLHTASASSTIDRIIDVFPAEQQTQIRVQLASSLVGVVSQQLFKRQDLSGRAGVYEILVNTPAVSNLIRQGKTYQIPNSIQTNRQAGMQTMASQLRDLILNGTIDNEEGMAYLSAITDDGRGA